jgi:hypothetical protein
VERGRVLLAAFGLYAAAGTGQGAERMENHEVPAPAPSPASLALDVRTVHADAGSLAFEYRLTNNGGAPVYAFTGVYRTDATGAATVDPDAVYSFVRDGGLVEFQKALLPVPPWTTVETPEVPFLTRLEPGATHREEVTVALPLRVNDPYDENYPEGHRAATQKAAGWKLTVGVLSDDPAHPVVRPAKSRGKDVLAVGYDEGLTRQVLVSSSVQPEAIAVAEPARTHERAFLKQATP